MSKIVWLVVLMSIVMRINAQDIYTAGLTKTHAPVSTNHLKTGHAC